MKINPGRICLGALAGLFTATSGWGYAYILNSTTNLPIKWAGSTAAYRILLGTSPVLSDGTNYSTSVQAAMQSWNGVLGSVQLQGEIANGSPVDHNGVNELAFDSMVYGQAFDNNVVAVTTTWYRGNHRVEGDIIFNSNRTWDSYRGKARASVDIQRVALHELGHTLGLDHPDDAGQTVAAIMNSKAGDIDALTSDDITGAQNLYGPPGTPANNSFSNATVISSAGNTATVSGYNTNATKELGEPNHAGNIGGRSVWWKWTAPSSGSVALDTRGSYFDTTLGVYTGASVSTLTTTASNDDIQSGAVQASAVTFNAGAGVSYFIAVDGFFSTVDNLADCGGITLNLTFAPAAGTPPSITSQPASATATIGTNASFTVVAAPGSSPPAYQWFFNNGAINGATSSTLNLDNVQPANAGSYFVTVSNSSGSVTSNTVTLTVTAVATSAPASSSGGGGGGAPSIWFCTTLSLLALSRRLASRRD